MSLINKKISKYLSETGIDYLVSNGLPEQIEVTFRDDNLSISYEGDINFKVLCEVIDAPLKISKLIKGSYSYHEQGLNHKIRPKVSKDLKKTEDLDVIDEWESRIASHLHYSLNIVINHCIGIVNSALVGEFRIPDSIKENFTGIGNGFESIKNWQAKIVLGNNISSRDHDGWEGEEIERPDILKIGDFDEVGYTMIGLETGLIIPIARSDEHHMGYDLVSEYIKKEQIPNGRYYPIFSTNYEPSQESDITDFLTAIRIWRKLGGPNYTVEGGHRKNFLMTFDDYLKCNGKVKHFIEMKGHLYPLGEELIKLIENLITLFRNMREGRRVQKKKICKTCSDIKTCVDTITSVQYGLRKSWGKSIEALEEAIINEGIDQIEQIIFAHNGLKNTIHMDLKAQVSNKNEYEVGDYIAIFGDLDVALAEFNRISNY